MKVFGVLCAYSGTVNRIIGLQHIHLRWFDVDVG